MQDDPRVVGGVVAIAVVGDRELGRALLPVRPHDAIVELLDEAGGDSRLPPPVGGADRTNYR